MCSKLYSNKLEKSVEQWKSIDVFKKCTSHIDIDLYLVLLDWYYYIYVHVVETTNEIQTIYSTY